MYIICFILRRCWSTHLIQALSVDCFCVPTGISTLLLQNVFLLRVKVKMGIKNALQGFQKNRGTWRIVGHNYRKKKSCGSQTDGYFTVKLRLSLEFSFHSFFLLFHFTVTAGAYYPAQPQYSPSVQPAPVMINPAQQQQQAPPPQQPPAQSQGPPKRERKPVVCYNKRAARLLSEVKKKKKNEWTESVLSVQCGTFPFTWK